MFIEITIDVYDVGDLSSAGYLPCRLHHDRYNASMSLVIHLLGTTLRRKGETTVEPPCLWIRALSEECQILQAEVK